MQQYSSESIQKTIDLCREEMAKCDALSPVLRSTIELILQLLMYLLVKTTPRNSSMPPSRDPNFRAEGRSKSRRRPGGQEGHQGVTLQPVEKPDQIISIQMKPEDVPPGYRNVGYEARQVFDIILKRHVTEYRADVYEDDKGHRLVAPFPADVAREVQYGNTTKAHVVYLNVGQMLPYNRIQDYLGENGLPLSEGSIYNFVADAYARLEDFERWAVRDLYRSEYVNFDETGIRVCKKGWWLHSASTHWTSLFMAHPKRGTDAMDAMGILPRFCGVAIHDFWKPYLGFESCRHVFCGTHLLRELEGVKEKDRVQWPEAMADLLLGILKTKEDSGGVIPLSVQQGFREEYRAVLIEGEKESPPPQPRRVGENGKKKRGRVAKTKGRNLWERFKDCEDGILAFMTDPAIPFTNNQAERDIRMTRVHEKVSGGFRSPQGALFYCRIRSYLSTCSKRGIPGHEALRLLFSGALPDFVNLAEIPGELMEIALPNARREDMETENPQDTTSSQAEQSE